MPKESGDGSLKLYTDIDTSGAKSAVKDLSAITDKLGKLFGKTFSPEIFAGVEHSAKEIAAEIKNVNKLSESTLKKTEKLTREYSRQVESITKQEIALDDMKRKYDALVAGEKAPASLLAMESQMKRITKEIEFQEKEQEKLTEQYIEANKRLSSMQRLGNIEGIEKNQTAISRLDKELLKIGETIDGLKGQFSDLSEKAEKVKLHPALSSEAQNLSHKIKAASDRLSESANNTKALNKEITLLNEDLKSCEKYSSQLHDVLQQISDSDIDISVEGIEDSKESLSELKEEWDEIADTDADIFTQSMRDIADEAAKITEEVAKQKDEYLTLADFFDQYESELESARVSGDKMAESLAKVNLEKASTGIDETSAKVENLYVGAERLREEFDQIAFDPSNVETADLMKSEIDNVALSLDEAAESAKTLSEEITEAFNIGKTPDVLNDVAELSKESKKTVRSFDESGKKSEKASKDVKKLGDESKRAARSVGELGKKSDKASKDIKKLGDESRKTARSAGELGKKAEIVVGGVKKLANETKSAAHSVGELGGKSARASKVVDKLGDSSKTAAHSASALSGKTDKVSTGVKKLGNESKKAESRIRSVTRGLGRLFNGLKSLAVGALVFNGIYKAMGKVRDLLGFMLKENEEFARSWNNIQVNLLTVFAPITQMLQPTLINFAKILEGVTYRLAQFTSRLFGTTYEQSKAAAEAMYNQAKAIDATGKSAKKATKDLMPFDDIIKQTSEEDPAKGLDFSQVQPPDTTWIDNALKKIKPLTDFFKRLWDLLKPFFTWVLSNGDKVLKILLAIALAIAAFKVINTLGNALKFLVENLSLIAGLTFVGLGVALAAFVSMKKLSPGLTVALGLLAGALVAIGTAWMLGFGKIGWIAGALAGITTAVIAIGNGLSKDAIPAVERFGAGVSEMTKAVVGEFMDMLDETTVVLKTMAITGDEVTEEMAAAVIGNYRKMREQAINELTQQRAETVDNLKYMFQEEADVFDDRIDMISDKYSKLEEELKNNTALTKEEYYTQLKNLTDAKAKEIIALGASATAEQKAYLEVMANTEKAYTDKQIAVEEKEEAIRQIMKQSQIKYGKITEEAYAEIQKLNEEFFNAGIMALTDNQQEQEIIIDKNHAQLELKEKHYTADMLEREKAAGDERIRIAQDTYAQAEKDAERFREQGTAEANAYADAVLEDAKRNLNETLDFEKEKYAGVVEEARKGFKDLDKEINISTGKIKNTWKDFWGGIGKFFSDTWDKMTGKVKHTSVSANLGGSSANVSARSVPIDIGVSNFKLPMLASGAVLPPNKPFAAIVGDQTQGMNIETPVELMRDTFNEAQAPVVDLLAELIDAVKEGKVLAVDRMVLGRIVNKSQAEQYKRSGYTTTPI